jgi:hypothetical protein
MLMLITRRMSTGRMTMSCIVTVTVTRAQILTILALSQAVVEL